MNRLLRFARNDVFKGGFTLIELLVVMAIMSILVVISVSQFQTAKKKGNDVARKSDLNGVSKALQMYFADYGVMPSVTDGKINNVDWGGEFKDGDYVYMKVMPKENSLSLPPYCYKTDASLKKYALFAQLENTVDKECDGHTYTCENGTSNKTYCFAYVSPNTSLLPNGDLQ